MEQNIFSITLSSVPEWSTWTSKNAVLTGDERLLMELSNIIRDDRAQEFILLIRYRTPQRIHAEVNRWVQQKWIDGSRCGKPLWRVLHDAGLYTRSYNNWITYVK